jgi:hypothetical protein
LSAINPPPREALLRSQELLTLLELEPWLLTAVPLELPPNHGFPFEFEDEASPRSNLYTALRTAMADGTAPAFLVANANAREQQALLRMYVGGVSGCCLAAWYCIEGFPSPWKRRLQGSADLYLVVSWSAPFYPSHTNTCHRFLVVHAFYDFFDKNRPCPTLRALLQRAEVLDALAIREVKPFYDFLASGPVSAAAVDAGDELRLLFSDSPDVARGTRQLMVNHLAIMLGMPLEKSYYLNIARNATQLKPMGNNLAIGSNYDNSYRDCGFRCEVGPNAVPVMQGGYTHFNGCLLSHTVSNSYTWMAMCWGSLVFGDAYLGVIADPANHVLNYVNQDVYAARGVQRSPRAAQNYYLLTRAVTFHTFSSQVPTLATRQMEASFFFTQSLLQMFNASLVEGPAGLPSLPVLTQDHINALEGALKRNVFDYVLNNGPQLQAALEVTERLQRKLESGLRDECAILSAFVSKQPIFPSFYEFQFELSKVPEREATINFCKAVNQYRVVRHLPLLVRFYVWLHETLDFRYTLEEAEQASIERIVEDVGRLDGPAAGLQAETLVHLVCEAWPEITANVSVDLCPLAARERAFEGYLLELNRQTVLARLITTADDQAGGEVYRVILTLLGLQNKILRAAHVRTLVENQQLNQNRILCPDALFPQLHISFLTSNDRRILRVPDDFEFFCTSRCIGIANQPGVQFDFDAVDKAILGLLGGCHTLSTVTVQHAEFKRNFRFNTSAADAAALLAAAQADPDLKGVFRLDEEEVLLARPLRALQEEAQLWPLTELDAAEARIVEQSLANRSERALQRCITRLCDIMRCLREQALQRQPDDPDGDVQDQQETFEIPPELRRVTLQAFVQKQKLVAADELTAAFGRLQPVKWRAAAAKLSMTVLGMQFLFQDLGVAFNTPLDMVFFESNVDAILQLDAYLLDAPHPFPRPQADQFVDTVHHINKAIGEETMPEYELLQTLLHTRDVTLVFAFREGFGELPCKEALVTRKDVDSLATLEKVRLTFVIETKERFLTQLQSLATSLYQQAFITRLRKAGNDKAPLRHLLADSKLLDKLDPLVVDKFVPLDVYGCHFSKYVRFLHTTCGKLQLSLVTLRERIQRTHSTRSTGVKYVELVPTNLADVQNELETGAKDVDSDEAPLTPGGGNKHVSYANQGNSLREFVQKLRYVDTQPWTSKPQSAPVRATVPRAQSVEFYSQTPMSERGAQMAPESNPQPPAPIDHLTGLSTDPAAAPHRLHLSTAYPQSEVTHAQMQSQLLSQPFQPLVAQTQPSLVSPDLRQTLRPTDDQRGSDRVFLTTDLTGTQSHPRLPLIFSGHPGSVPGPWAPGSAGAVIATSASGTSFPSFSPPFTSIAPSGPGSAIYGSSPPIAGASMLLHSTSLAVAGPLPTATVSGAQVAAVSQPGPPVAAPAVGIPPDQPPVAAQPTQTTAPSGPQATLSMTVTKNKADMPWPLGHITKQAQIGEEELMRLADSDLVPFIVSGQGKKLFPLRVVDLLRGLPTEEQLQSNIPAGAVVVTVAGVRRVACKPAQPIGAVATRLGIRIEDVQVLASMGLLALQGDQVLTPAAQIENYAADLAPIHEAFSCSERSASILGRGVVHALKRGEDSVVLRSSRAAFLKKDWHAECVAQAEAIDIIGVATVEEAKSLLDEYDKEESAYFSLPAQASLGAAPATQSSSEEFWFLRSGPYFA